MGVEHSELTRLAKDLQGVPAEVDLRAPFEVGQVEADCVAMMRANSAVGTGNMRDGTTSTRTDGGLGFTAGPTADYAPLVVYGTSRQAPQDNVNPAMDAAVDQLEQRLADVGLRALR